MTTITIEGTVVTGEGNGRKFMELDWVTRQIEDKMCFSPYPGTLNLIFSEENLFSQGLFEKAKSFEISPPVGYCVGLFFKAKIGSLECGVLVPRVEGYPKDLLEIIAPVYLREALSLKDGDSVCVTVFT